MKINTLLFLKTTITYLKLKLHIKTKRHDVWRLDLFLFCFRNKIRILNETEKYFIIATTRPILAKYYLRHYPTSDFSVFKSVILSEQYSCINSIFNTESDMKVVDAGSNVGYSSIYFKKKYPNSEIIAIEPFNQNVQVLSLNLTLNNLYNINIEERALWFEETKLFLDLTFRDMREHSIRTIAEYSNSNSKVETITLDMILKKYKWNRIDFLKIDIEGAEKYIFENYASLNNILKITKVIAIEIHDELDCRKKITDTLKAHYNFVYENGELTIGHN